MIDTSARTVLEDSVRRELFGPEDDEAARGRPLDCTSGTITFASKEESWGLWHDSASGQEVLTESDPLRRYGVGVLHPGAGRSQSKSELIEQNLNDVTWVSGLAEGDDTVDWPIAGTRGALRHDEADSDDFDLSDANTFKPSAMAVSFKCRIRDNGQLEIRFKGAYYDHLSVSAPEYKSPRDWWVRRPVELVGRVTSAEIRDRTGRLARIDFSPASDAEPRVFPVGQLFCRKVPGEDDSNVFLVTVAVVNQSPGNGSAQSLFQSRFEVVAKGGITIEHYPETAARFDSEEEESLELLYRHRRTYAIGHGCAANWEASDGDAVTSVQADPLPAYEVTSLTPDIYVVGPDGERRPIVVSMFELSHGTEEGNNQVESVLRLYGDWIKERERQISSLADRYNKPAQRHLELCRFALARMQTGWDMVSNDSTASLAFRLANRAMLEQQIRSRLPLRNVNFENGLLQVDGEYPEPNLEGEHRTWRPFQIAFLLASLPELVDRKSTYRELVDLIFFPTGGGKTEAYLAASTLSLLARRLRSISDSGTDTLMRYTLRLLTAQQFLRAASLICALESIRSEIPELLGSTPFGIGVWLGGSSTPNTWTQAIESLQKLTRDENAENPFLLLRCPWCGTQMGTRSRGRGTRTIAGYERVGRKVILRCPDVRCKFGGRRGALPVHVVDEDIYEVRPSIIIGTVDKFAMLAWRPSARRLFGLGDNGDRDVSPPGLIIQDELHLISGPLGSMVGLYEPVIESLCTDERGETPVRPKIIASAATVRHYGEQVLSLFGRPKVALFPPHGLEDGHSFFAEISTNDDGAPLPGRRYLGVFSSSLGSTQTVQVRVAAATLQGALAVAEEDRDRYWTNLNFFNSLRELGNTVSLLESDVPDYLTGLRRRDGYDEIRWPRVKMELTSRRRSDEIPKAIDQLQLRYGEPGVVDICLASNIIEVGVDIDRLGLMTIVGQPKTTAQYIQVSGRVGRRADINPGLVITIYGAAKPRDRSHYERFRSYHETLYAQVEPTSVTPFAAPVLRRALHAAVVAHLRQTSPDTLPYPFPRGLFGSAVSLLKNRARVVDPAELSEVERAAEMREREWEMWERTEWDANDIGGDPSQGLMRYSGTAPDLSSRALVWDVPSSLRNVDAECRIKISLDYNRADGSLAEDEL